MVILLDSLPTTQYRVILAYPKYITSEGLNGKDWFFESSWNIIEGFYYHEQVTK